MRKRSLARTMWIVLAAGCFVMSGLTLAGVFAGTAGKERVLFGIGWAAIGAGWIGRYALAEARWRREAEENRDRRERTGER